MSTPEPDYDTPLPEYHTPPALIAFTLSVLILCFVAFSIVCICKYCFASTVDTWAFQRTASGSLIRLPPDRSLPRGLDPTLLEGFPTFLYACVKDHRKEKSYSLECAICLLEFEDDSLIRLLTICCHVFHKECIDLWLHSHKTCPVCRTELNSLPPKNPMPKYFGGEDNINHNAQESMASSTSNNICIDVKERDTDDGVGDRVGDQRHEHEQRDHHMSMQQEEQKIARSHSTGHSIVLIRGGGEEKDDDKYTLRLPEHVIRGGNYYCSRGCTSCRDNCGFVQPVSDGSSSVAHAQES